MRLLALAPLALASCSVFVVPPKTGGNDAAPPESEGEGEGVVAGEGEGVVAGEGEGVGGEGEGASSSGEGTVASPIVIGSFPFHDARDTTEAPESSLDAYSCAPSTDESGGEWVYTFTLAERGAVTVHIGDDAANGVDIDAQLLSAPSADACLARANADLSSVLDPGTYFLVADTYVAGGVPQAGPFTIDVDFHAITAGSCALQNVDVAVFWSSCDPSIVDCDDSGANVVLHTPTSGPVVEEAHLATDADGFGDGWPTSFTDGIANHYAVSQAASGFDVARDQPWAPAGEGGSQFGEGATGAKVPVLDEAWYINMYWRNRPAGGTRMIVKNPANGRAVVVSAGWETGPGSNTAIAGVTEEVHHWLGTQHLDTLQIGFAEDTTLPLGPIDCP